MPAPATGLGPSDFRKAVTGLNVAPTQARLNLPKQAQKQRSSEPAKNSKFQDKTEKENLEEPDGVG